MDLILLILLDLILFVDLTSMRCLYKNADTTKVIRN